jgi:two-component sensor histidine kinase
MEKEVLRFQKYRVHEDVEFSDQYYTFLLKRWMLFGFIFLVSSTFSFGVNQVNAEEFSKIKTSEGQIYVMRNFESTREVLDSYFPILSNRGNKKAIFFWYYAKDRNIMLYPNSFQEGKRNLKIMTDFAKKHDLEIEFQITEYLNTVTLRANNKIDIQQHYSKFLNILESMRKIGFNHFVDFDLEILMYNFGLLFYEIGDYEKALLALKEGEKNKVTSIKSIYQTLNLNLIENIYSIQKDYDKSIVYAQKIYELNRGFNPKLDPTEWRSVFWQGFSTLSIAEYKLRQGKFQQAENLAIKGYEIINLNQNYEELQQLWAEFEAIQLLLQIKLKLNKRLDSESLVKRTEEIVKKLKIKADNEDFRLIKYYNNLSDYYEKKGNSQKSLYYLKNARKLEILKEVQNDKRNLWRIEMRVKAEDYQTNLARIEDERNQQNMLTYAVIVVFVLGFVVAFLSYQRISSKNKTIDLQKDDLQKNLLEKENLLKEIHHRVKNNLQIISVIFDKQARLATDEQTKKLMREGQDRVFSIALVHENLYQSENLTTIRMRTYLEMLTQNIENSHKNEHQAIELSLDVDDSILEIDTAIPLGLILNELITNCYKYAFKNRTLGKIQICFHKKENDFVLTVKDNGIGLSDDFDVSKTKTLGMNLIRGLVRQISGKLDFSTDNQGTVFSVIV